MKNFTKQFKQITSRLSARWLIMALMMLVGTSSACGWTVYYVNSTNWNKLYIHYWGGTNPSPSSWGDNPPMVVQGEKVLGLTIYSYEIGDNTSCIFKDNKGDTSNKTGDLTSLQPDKPYYYDGKWYSIRELYENFWMFYMYQSYGGTLCLKADNNTVASNTTTQMATSGYAYVVVEKTKVDGKTLNVSNNCGEWNGTGDKKGGNEVGTEKVHPGCFYKTGSSNTIIKASTLSSLSIASSINKADANSVAIKVKSTSSTSSYSNGNTNYALKAMFYVDNKYYGTSNQLSTSETSTTLDLSDLADGQHTLSVVLTDGKIYYSDSKTTTFTIVSCTPPGAPELTSPDAQCGGSITLPATYNEFTLKWYDENVSVVDNTTITSSGTYYAAAVGECESIERTPYTITINPVPSFTTRPSNVTLCSSTTDISVAELIAETKATASNSATIKLYDGNGVEITEPIDINTQTTTTYQLKASTQTCSSDFVSFTLTVNPLPDAPSLTSPAPVCEGTKVNLPTEGLKWYDAETGGTEVQNTSITATGTYWAAAVQNECESATRTRYDVTVNPEPTIGSITQNVQSPVPFEDVVLTANNVTDGAQVKWYVEENLIAENTNTYTVTSETAGDVIVKAKAFLNGCESATTKTVKFSAEDCSDRENTTTTRKTKITCSIPSGWKQISCYTYDSNKREYSGGWPGTVMTSDGNNYSIVIDVDDNMKDLYVIFNNNNNGEQTKDPSPITGGFSYTAGNVGKGQTPTFTKGTAYNESTTTTTPAEITAPAVKMVSAEYDEENDVIVAKGAVYKTGCGTTFWGFQYSTDGQTWGTTNEYFIHPSGNSLSVPGEFEYSFAIPNAGGGDIYYIRAYALNNYNKDSYNLSSAVYSTTSLPVEIPSKTIESATISLVDSEGKPSDATVVCPQSTVYLKVSYVGGDFKEYEAADNFPGTNLELVNHDKVNNYAIFSYTATATGVANITISNENTSVTPEEGMSITVKEVTLATPPTIYLEKNTICDNQTTNVVVNSPIVGSIYSLKNGTVGDPVTYESGDLKFPVSKEGSYTVQVQETECGTIAISAPVDLRVITSDVKITLTTDVNTINPWQPLTLTVKAPSGYDYDLQGLDGMVYTKKGDVYTIKIPRPEGEDWKTGNTSSPEGTATKTFTASIKAGEDTSCSTTTKEVTLVDTEEECLAVGN